MSWWIANLASTPTLLVSWIVWVLASIVLHELAHGLVAIRLGDRTPIESGHMTWNPLVHMGGMSLLMFALVGIAWGQMPINPRRLRGRHADALVAMAGPLMNLALALVAIVACGLWLALYPATGTALYVNVAVFLSTGAMLNLFLMAFNLLPIPPLDGSSVLSTWSPAYRALIRSPNAGAIMLLLFVLLFVYGGRYLFGFARAIADGSIDGIARLFA